MLSIVPPALQRAFSGPETPSALRRFTLENGLTVLIQPSRKAGTVAVYLGVESGSADEGDRLGSGLSHYLEHMLFKGTPSRKAGEIEDAVRRMGGTANAYTSYDVTVYYMNVLAPHLGTLLELMSDVTFNSDLPAEEFERERQVIFGEFRMNDDRISRVAQIALWESVFASHPYGRPVIGYREIFEKIGREDLLAYYRRNYVPNNVTLSIAGDVDAAEAEKMVRKYFGSVSRGLLDRSARVSESPQLTTRRVSLRKKSQHARLVLGYASVPLSHADAPALDVLSGILGEGNGSRLNQALREKERLALEIDSYNSTLRDAGLFGISAIVPVESVATARASVQKVIETLSRDGVTEPELERIKNQVLARTYANLETHDAMAHDALTSEIYTGDPDFSRAYAEKVKRVSAADVRLAAAKYLGHERLNEVILLPESAGRLAEETAAVSAPDKPYKITLSNGLRVLFFRDKSSPTVAVHFAVPGGVRFESDRTAGSSRLLAKLMEKGTAKLGQEELARTVEGWGGSLSAFSGQNSYGLSLASLSQHLGDALSLFASLVYEPALAEEEFDKEKKAQLESVLAKKDDVFSFATDALRKALFRNHPYRLDPLGTEESLSKLKRADIQKFYRETLDPARAVLSVAGDFDPKTAEALVRKAFDRPLKAAAQAPSFAPEPPLSNAVLRVETPREQAVVLLGFRAVSVSDPRRYAFEALNAALNDSAGRLYKSVRGKAGLSYVVGSGLSLGADPGYMSLYASVSPENADSTLAMLVAEVDLLRKEGLSQEELEAVKTQLIGNRERTLESKDGRSLETAFGELYGISLEEFAAYSERVRALKAADVSAVIREFLDPSKAARVVVSPREEKKS